jgi:predicted peptidase
MAQTAHTFDSKRSRRGILNYLLFLPRGYRAHPERTWPLIMFLHGADERGDDIELVKKHGIPKIAEQQKGFPFIAVSPQCPAKAGWQLYLRTLNDLIDYVISKYRADAEQLYLTGISMGGYGTWHLAAKNPDRFAAVVPICGGGYKSYGFPEKACRLKDTPIWAFHGALDRIVPVEESEKVVEVVRSCGGHVRFTIYPDAGHDAWTRTYQNPELYGWLLRHRRGDPISSPEDDTNL